MFCRDNPGGEWLLEKQERALSRYAPHECGIAAKGLVGAVTAWTRTPVMVDTVFLSTLRGVNNENRRAGDHQYDALTESVGVLGWDEGQLNNAVLIGVNHLGRAFIIEGNTRAKVAADIGVDAVRAEIRWFNGAEGVDGPFCLKNDAPLWFIRETDSLTEDQFEP